MGILWELSNYIFKATGKELICLSKFWFLPRFCLKAEEREKEIRCLELRDASSSHIKRASLKMVENVILARFIVRLWITKKNKKSSPAGLVLEFEIFLDELLVSRTGAEG